MAIRKNISIPEKDRDIIPYLENQPNMSQYLVRLVRADMQKKDKLTREDVIRLIEQYIRKTEVSTNMSDVKNSIKDILGWAD